MALLQLKSRAIRKKHPIYPEGHRRETSEACKVMFPTLPDRPIADRLTSDSFLDPPGLSDVYRQLRHKYLLLEEESFSLDRELDEVDAEVKSLEDEKLALLDQLVVLEGLVDPSEIKRAKIPEGSFQTQKFH